MSEPVALLDVNVLIALAWPSHVFHHAAHDWFRRNADAGWATCSTTGIGFVRISSNPRALPGAGRPADAVSVLRTMRKSPSHRFWTDDVAISDTRLIDIARVATHSQVTDAHLLALARRHEGRVASFDRGLARLLAPGERGAAMLIPDSIG